MLRLGPGLPARLNPLDAAGTADRTGQRIAPCWRRSRDDAARRELGAAEHGALDAALATAERRGSTPTIGDVLDALAAPDPAQARADGVALDDRVADGRDVAHGLRRLVRGDLAGLFDGPSTVRLDPHAPMVVLDLSALGSDDDALSRSR